jgi:hypothetical protein
MRVVLIACLVTAGLVAAVAASFVTLCCGSGEDSPVASPTPLSGTIPWDDAVDLIEDCEVTAVMQTHALDVYLTLDDGAEVQTVEPEIDLVLGIAAEAMEDCGPITMATE